jgi:hypothetical protein
MAMAWVGAAATVAIIAGGGAPASADPPGDKEKPVQTTPARPDPTFPAKEKAASGHVVSSPSSRAALAKVQKRIAADVAKNGTTYTFGTYADPATGAVVVDTDAPDSVLNPLIDLSRDKDLKSVKVKVNKGKVKDAWNRRDDTAPYYGGGGLLASNALCSAGYAVKNSAGTRFMVTAGHCYANGTTVQTESNLRTVGTVSNRALASLGSGPVDMELLGGQSYAGRVFSGGVTSTTSNPVVAAGDASVNYNAYCHSGRTTGEQCGHTATSVTAQVCTGTGCKSPVIAYTGGTIQQGGDSGGAFYAKDGNSGVWIRGHVIASSSTTGYVEKWTKVASRYGVSIVTG